MKNRTYLLAVQGEGRGHLMQCLCVYDLLTSRGHDVCCIVVGLPTDRVLPEFFRRRIGCPLVTLGSPGFVKRGGRSISLFLSIWRVLTRLPEHVSSLRRFDRLVAYHRPDAIVNFYEPLAGLHGWLRPGSSRRISIAHQYVYLHEGYDIPGSGRWQQFLLRAFTGLTSAGSDRRLALSIVDMPSSRDVRLRVVPPILRREVMDLRPSDEGFVLVYLVNSGYMSDILRWHAAHPDVRLHCFTDDEGVRARDGRRYRVDDTLTFHAIDDRLFLEMLASCRAVVTSAGFETVCEAVLLGKPLLMVPVEGHREQLSNALDAERLGIAGWSTQYDIGRVLTQAAAPSSFHDEFRRRVREMQDILLEELEGRSPATDAKVVEMPVRLGRAAGEGES
jgi:uncharacterized protein (TIGR00661 family)